MHTFELILFVRMCICEKEEKAEKERFEYFLNWRRATLTFLTWVMKQILNEPFLLTPFLTFKQIIRWNNVFINFILRNFMIFKCKQANGKMTLYKICLPWNHGYNSSKIQKYINWNFDFKKVNVQMLSQFLIFDFSFFNVFKLKFFF